MKYQFFIPKIETRSSLKKGVKQYVIQGYATTKNNTYDYKKELSTDGVPIRTFKEFFTDRGIENLKRRAQNEKIFVDYGHQIASELNINKILNDVETRSGLTLTEEKDYIMNAINTTDIPMFKINDLKVDDKGLFVDVRANPFFREADEEHEKYFDAIWGSLENGFINGMSLNFKPTDFVDLDNNTRQIDDVAVYGISLLSGAANDMANITEVAMRCVEYVRGEAKCQKMELMQ